MGSVSQIALAVLESFSSAEADTSPAVIRIARVIDPSLGSGSDRSQGETADHRTSTASPRASWASAGASSSTVRTASTWSSQIAAEQRVDGPVFVTFFLRDEQLLDGERMADAALEDEIGPLALRVDGQHPATVRARYARDAGLRRVSEARRQRVHASSHCKITCSRFGLTSSRPGTTLRPNSPRWVRRWVPTWRPRSTRE